MDEEPDNSRARPGAGDAPAPILEYRPPRDEKHPASGADAVKGGISIGLGSVLLIFAVMTAILLPEGRIYNDHIGAWAAIMLLLLAGVAAAIRSAWFYLGGWSQMDDRGKEIRKIKLPWNWG